MKTNLKDIKTENVHSGTTLKKALLPFSDKNGTLATYNYAWVEKGNTLEAHKHPDGEEYYLFLEGEGEMLVGETWFPVEKGDFVKVPEESMHSLKNHSDQNLVFITLRTITK